MKKLFILILLFPATMMAQEIKWMSLAEALEAQKKEPRKIMMDVYTNWCGPCKMMDKHTFQNKDVAKYVSKNYYAVKFNAEGNEVINYKGKKFENPGYDPKLSEKRNAAHEFMIYMQVPGFPTVVFMDEKGDFITPVTGYRTPKQFEMYLKVFKDDTYKKITTSADWQTYQQNFVSKFN